MLIPKIIHFTIPERPSDFQRKNIDTARELHPDWSIQVWQDPVDRAAFTLSEYWDKANSGAQLADLIRLETVYQHGGFYLDSDIKLHKCLDPLRAYSFVIASEDGHALTNAFFGAVPKSPVMKHLIDTLDRIEPDWQLPANITTGPWFFARALKRRNDVTVIPRDTFYPFHWHDRWKDARLWTYGTHQWTHSWGSTTGSDQPVRAIARRLRWRFRNTRHRLLLKVRNSLLSLRHLLRLYRPTPYSATGVICAQTLHGPKIYLSGQDGSVTPEIALHGTYEFNEELFVKRLVRGGDWVIDVGANVGIFSLLCAQGVGTFGRVYSYEPNPVPATLLKQSVLMNWLHDRIEVRQRALGAEASRRKLHFSPECLGGATLATRNEPGAGQENPASASGDSGIDVDVSTLDIDFPVPLPIRLLKIDVEGFEHQVLRGGSQLLENHCVDVLMLECLPELSGDCWNDLVSELERIVEFGYEPYTLARSAKLKRGCLKQMLHTDRGRNIVLISRHATNTIPGIS